MNTKQKGDILEDIIHDICRGVRDAIVEKNVKILGKTKLKRQIDILIKGKSAGFDVLIAIEAKNFNTHVPIEKVEAFNTKISDIGANLGVMVASKGFTSGAKEAAELLGIQLFEVYDQRLGNSDLFLPVRCVEPYINTYSVSVIHRASGGFDIPADNSLWRFKRDEKVLDIKSLVALVWNEGKLPHSLGIYNVNLNAMTFFDINNPDKIQYLEIELHVEVKEKYYLKLFPASFLKKYNSDKKKFHLKLDLYSEHEDRLKNGWVSFDSLEEMNKAANIKNQPAEIKNLLLVEDYILELD